MKSVGKKERIIIVNLGNIFRLPPVISLVKCLLNNGYSVYLISEGIDKLPRELLETPDFAYVNIESIEGSSIIVRLWRRFLVGRKYRKACFGEIKSNDVLWTTSDITVRVLGRKIIKYRHIMQIMELEKTAPLFKGARFLTFPIDSYARKAYKVVVPEIHRAYLEKVWWGLNKTPSILPNKPYSLESSQLSIEAREALTKIKNEKRKVIVYLGSITANSNFDAVLEAVKYLSSEYALYIIGGISSYGSEKKNQKTYKELLDSLVTADNAINYLGYFESPMHLEFLQYAYIGLISYTINHSVSYEEQMNVLFCAPNKVFEYAAFGVPMIGDDILGLREPFEKFEIGVCCNIGSTNEIVEAIREIGNNHDVMSSNCKEYYNSVEYEKAVNEILQNPS